MFKRAGARERTWATFIGLFVGATGAFWANHASAERFSITCMPDPQYYTYKQNPKYDIYRKQAVWIRDNKATHNIKHVIWLGDLTNNNTDEQWITADGAYDVLDAYNIPFAVVPGNHDYKPEYGVWTGANFRDLTRYNGIVGPDRFAGKPWYGGNMGETLTHNENNYTYFSAAGLDFLVIGLEYAPRKDVLTWANNLISAHPNHRVILFTHSYLTRSGSYGGNAGSAAGTVGATGADIFDECASRHSNVFMVVCGHVTDSVVNNKTGVSGNRVYEMLVDYQGEEPLGTGGSLGNGWLRLLKFDTDTDKISADTFTVVPGNQQIFHSGIPQFYHSAYTSNPRGADHVFDLDYDMGPLPPYTYLNASLGFHAMGMGQDLYADELDPDIGQAANGDWVSVWEEDDNDDGFFDIYMRGFDSDGNGRLPKTRVNTSGVIPNRISNPAMAMAPDGRYVVVWQEESAIVPDAKYINMRSFNADGTPVGSFEQNVVTVTRNNSSALDPDVAIDDAGNFVVTWGDDADGNNTFQVKARGFSFNYAERFSAKTVNSIAAGQQQKPKIAMAGNGDYAITWQDNKDATWDINVRGYNADETDKFAQMLAHTIVTGEQITPDIAMNDDGQFVIAWEDDYDLNSAYQVMARGFEASGAELFADITVNLKASGNQIAPSVDMDSNGYWYCAWEDSGQGGRGFQMMANVFNLAGARINSSDIRANPVTNVTHVFNTPARKQPVISAHRSGRYIVAWADDMDGNDAFQTLACGIPGRAHSLVVKHIGGTVSRSLDEPFYAPGDQVTLTAHPDPGYSFVKWQGDVPTFGNTAESISFVMDRKRSVTAVFSSTADVDDWVLY